MYGIEYSALADVYLKEEEKEEKSGMLKNLTAKRNFKPEQATITSKQKLLQNNIKIIDNQSHIVSVIIGDALKAKKFSKSLLENHNIYIQHINYPTVAVGEEILRIIITPLHTDAMIDDLIFSLNKVL